MKGMHYFEKAMREESDQNNVEGRGCARLLL